MFSTRHVLAITVSSLASMCTAPEVVANDGPKVATEKQVPAPGTPEYIERALRKKVSLTVEKALLRDVLKDLSNQVDAPILVESSALDAVGLFADETRVTISLRGLSLRSVLRVVLSELGLTYMNYDGVVLVTTYAAAEQNLVTRIYEVVDLISRDEDTPPSDYDYSSLIEVVKLIVAPTVWDEVGGPCTITGYRGTIVVSAPREILDHITGCLDGMRKAKKMAAKHRDTAPPVVSIPLSGNGELPEEEKAIFKALESIVSLDFEKISLKDVAADLRKKHKVNVYFQKTALSAVGLGTNTPVTFSCKKVKLGQALNLLLREMELTFFVGDGVLVITTPISCEPTTSRAYPILDLVDIVHAMGDPPGEERSYDYEALGKLIEYMIAPSSWEEVGGEGSIEVVRPHGFVVISQYPSVHEKIERLLGELRRTAPQRARVTTPIETERVRLAVYLMPNPAAENAGAAEKRDRDRLSGIRIAVSSSGEPLSDSQMLESITSLIEPESWTNRGDVYARAAAGRIVIRHTDAVHRQIKELAKRLGVRDFREIAKR